jgi:hypothetical protein
VLALHGEDDDVAWAGRGLGGAARRVDPQDGGARRRTEGQAVAPEGRQVVAPGDERDVVAGLVEPAADGAAHRPGAVDDEPHRPRLADGGARLAVVVAVGGDITPE